MANDSVMNWKLWLQGLAAAAVGGAGSGFTQAVTTNGGHVNTGTAICAGVGALLTTVAYVIKSPLQRADPPAPTASNDPSSSAAAK